MEMFGECETMKEDAARERMELRVCWGGWKEEGEYNGSAAGAYPARALWKWCGSAI